MQAIAPQEIRIPENWCEMIKAAPATCGGNRSFRRPQPLPALPGPGPTVCSGNRSFRHLQPLPALPRLGLTACSAERDSVCGRDGGAGAGCGR